MRLTGWEKRSEERAQLFTVRVQPIVRPFTCNINKIPIAEISYLFKNGRPFSLAAESGCNLGLVFMPAPLGRMYSPGLPVELCKQA